MSEGFYGTDLAAIHDNGFGGYAEALAPGLLELLRKAGIESGQLVELGCGSGALTRSLCGAGYSVLAADRSTEMLRLARRHAPQADYRCESLYNLRLPPCRAVLAVGEVLNYIDSPRDRQRELPALFARAARVLEPGGLFVFDLAEPGQLPKGRMHRGFREGDGWAVLVEKWELPAQRLLQRRIVTFRRGGAAWRRSEELHCQRLYSGDEMAALLRSKGFAVRLRRRCGAAEMPPAHLLVIARRQ